MPTVSIVATLVATVLGFVLGGLWYGPLFGKAWMTENNFTAEHIRQSFSPAKAYGTTFVLGLISSYVFGMYLGPAPGVALGTRLGVAVGFCWVATSYATSYLFEGKSFRHLLINGGYHVVRFVLIGVAFGLLG